MAGVGMQRSVLQPPPSSAHALEHFKYQLFGVLHSMTEGKKPSRTAHRWFMVATFIDTLQLVALGLDPGFGWSSRDLGWLHNFSLLDLLLPNRNPSLFAGVFLATVLLVMVCAAAGMYVGRMFYTGVFKRVWPMKFLRAFVSIVVTAGFIPALQIMLAPLDCDAVQSYMADGYQCYGAVNVLFMVLSVLGAATLIPIGTVASLFFHTSNPNSSVLDSKISGKESAYTTVTKVILVYSTPFIRSHPVHVAVIYVAFQTFLCYYTCIDLPYFNRRINYLRAAVMGWSAYLAVGAVIAAASMGRASLDTDKFTLYWVAGSPVAILAAGMLPLLKYRRLTSRLMSLRPVMEQQLHAAAVAHADHSTIHRRDSAGTESSAKAFDATEDLKSTAQEVNQGKMTTHQKWQVIRQNRNRVVKHLNDAVVATVYMSMSNVLPLSERKSRGGSVSRSATPDNIVDEEAKERTAKVSPLSMVSEEGRASDSAAVPISEIDEHAYFAGLSARDVELLARIELDQPDSQSRSRQRWRAKRQNAPNIDGLSRAMWLFAEGIQEFTDDPRDIATVKISWAMYLHTFAGDLNLATSALESAHREMPGVDGQFEVFTRMRTLQQLRQSRDIGSSDQMNLISIIEFKKRFTQALHQHVTALKNLARVFALVSKIRRKKQTCKRASDGRLKPADAEQLDSMHETLGLLVAKSKDATIAAETIYKRLLEEHSNAPQVANAYARFCKDVLDDAERASMFLRTEGDGSTIKSGSQDDGSVAAMLYSRKLVPKRNSGAILEMDSQFKFGLALIIGLIIGLTALVLGSVERRFGDFGGFVQVGALRTLTVESANHARNLQLFGTALQDPGIYSSFPGGRSALLERLQLERNITLATAATFREFASNQYRHPHHKPGLAALKLWESSDSVHLTDLIEDGTMQNRTANLWDTLTFTQAQSAFFARSDETTLGSASTESSFRFLIDNCIPNILPRLLELNYAYQEGFAKSNTVFKLEGGGIILALILVLIYLGYGVFYKATKRVQVIKQGLSETTDRLPFNAINTLRQKYVLAARATRALAKQIEYDAEQAADTPRDDIVGSDDEGSAPSWGNGRAKGGPPSPRTELAASHAFDSEKRVPHMRLPADRKTRRQRSVTWGDDQSSLDEGSAGSSVAIDMDIGERGFTDAPNLEQRCDPRAAPSGPIGDVRAQDSDGDGDDIGLLAAASETSPDASSAESKELRPPASGDADSKSEGVSAMAKFSSSVVKQLKTASTLSDSVLVARSASSNIVCDEVGVMVKVTGPIEKALGYSASELVGNNVTMLQPPDVAKAHAGLMRRVVEGGKPRLVGHGVSRPVTAICKDGSSRDIVLGLERLDWHGKRFFSASVCVVQASQEHGAAEEDELANELGENEVPWYKSALGRAGIALASLAVLQMATLAVSAVTLMSSNSFSTELNSAGKLRYLSANLEYLSQELLVGDGEMWPQSQLLSQIDSVLAEYHELRLKLRFGGVLDTGYKLPGSVNRNPDQDALLFDTAPDAFDSAVHSSSSEPRNFGLDTLHQLYADNVMRLIEPFRDDVAAGPVVGRNVTALGLHSHFSFLEEQGAGDLATLLERSVTLYYLEAKAAIESVQSASIGVCITNVIVALGIYLFVFKAVANDMVDEAMRTENFLALLPTSVASDPRLAQFYSRSTT